MERGTRVKIMRMSNEHAQHLVGRAGSILGPAVFDILVVKLDGDGRECWVRQCNLRAIDD